MELLLEIAGIFTLALLLIKHDRHVHRVQYAKERKER